MEMWESVLYNVQNRSQNTWIFKLNNYLSILLLFFSFFFLPVPLLLIESFESESENVWHPEDLSFSSCKKFAIVNNAENRNRSAKCLCSLLCSTCHLCVCFGRFSFRNIILSSPFDSVERKLILIYSSYKKMLVPTHYIYGLWQHFTTSRLANHFKEESTYLETILKAGRLILSVLCYCCVRTMGYTSPNTFALCVVPILVGWLMNLRANLNAVIGICFDKRFCWE